MSLADPLAPKGIGVAIGRDRTEINAGERKQARIPADTHGAQFARTFSRLVERLEILRHFGVRVETVHRIEIADGFHRLYGQIGSAAAAQDHDVDLTDVILYIFNGIHCNGKDGTHCSSDRGG